MSEKEPIDIGENRNGDAVNENADGIENVDTSDDFMKALFKNGKGKQHNGDDVLRIFSDRDKEAKEKANKAANEKFSQDAFTEMAENYKQARERDEEAVRAAREAEEAKRRKLQSKPKKMAKGKKFALVFIGMALVASLGYAKGFNDGKEQGTMPTTEISEDIGDALNGDSSKDENKISSEGSVFEKSSHEASTKETKEYISDVQHRDNVNKLLKLIKQEIADRYDSIEANDITINVERNSNGELQIKVTDKDGKEIPVDQEKEDEIKVFVDYQNSVSDGTVTVAQKEAVQGAITTKESKKQEEQVKGKTITVLPEKEADDDTER